MVSLIVWCLFTLGAGFLVYVFQDEVRKAEGAER